MLFDYLREVPCSINYSRDLNFAITIFILECRNVYKEFKPYIK